MRRVYAVAPPGWEPGGTSTRWWSLREASRRAAPGDWIWRADATDTGEAATPWEFVRRRPGRRRPLAAPPVLVSVDEECNASTWWDALDEADPRLAARLREAGSGEPVRLLPEEWIAVQALPGWDDAHHPEYAPHPLAQV